jgi:Holliday junction DNA helicase RuvA
MISRISGILESIEGLEATIVPPASPLAYAVLVPTFLAQSLRDRLGQSITLSTLHYLEGQLGGSSLIPRLIGFASARERRFFELLTSVDGLGNRKALKALTQDPGAIAQAVARGDVAWLTQLPEIGKKTAEKVILELKGKVQPFLTAEEVAGMDRASTGTASNGEPIVEDAISALVALGETRADAERKVRLAISRHDRLTSTEQVLAAVYSG